MRNNKLEGVYHSHSISATNPDLKREHRRHAHAHTNPLSGVDPKQGKKGYGYARAHRIRLPTYPKKVKKEYQKRILDGNSDDLSLPKIASGRPSAAESIF